MSNLGQVIALLDRVIGRVPTATPVSTDFLMLMKSSGKRHVKATIADILALGTAYQPLDDELTAIAGLTSAADRVPYFTGSGTAALAPFTTAGRDLVGGADVAAQRSTLGLGTADLPVFAGLNIGDTSDTTVTRASAGNIQVEGNLLYRAGGTDVPVSDGGTGRSSHTAYAVLCGGTSTTNPQQSIASVGTGGQVLTSGGGGALPSFADRITYSLGGAPTTAISPADGSTYYWADAKIGLAPTTTAGDHRLYVPISGKIVGAVLTMYASTATGTGETITGSIRRNNSTNFEVGTVAAASAWRTITSSALDITVTAGDFICFMAAFPTWATNPTGIRCSGEVIIRGTA